MEEEAFSPEEIIVFILTFLPVKSLLRFTCVSKRFRFVILFDPKFAKSQLKAASDLKTLSHRLLLCTRNQVNGQIESESKSLESSSSSSSSSVRKLTLPFEQPALEESSWRSEVTLLGSANGIVFLAFHHRIVYMWNPSIGFFKRLPNLVLPPETNQLINYGVGYFPATDDYRVFVYSIEAKDDGYKGDNTLVFSTRAKAWKNHQVKTEGLFEFGLGTFLNEALHWVDRLGGIVAFDLGDEEGKYREMSSPSFENEDGGGYMHSSCLGVSPEGCLSLVCLSGFGANHYCINLWVLREYNVSDSWTKLVNLKLSDSPQKWYFDYAPVILMATILLAKLSTDDRAWAIKVNNIEEGNDHEMLKFEKWRDRIHYEETLIRIHD